VFGEVKAFNSIVVTVTMGVCGTSTANGPTVNPPDDDK
jgi:hypothetical protein